jgi:uncharacterized phage protein gp47/JayE
MPFPRPSLGDLRVRIAADYRARFPGADTNLRQSPDRALVEVIAGASDEDLAYLDWQVRQLFAFSADVEYLERWAAQKGLARKVATRAAGTVTLLGTPNTTAPAGQQLQTAAGVAIVTLADATTDVSGSVTVAAQAVGGGAAGNLGVGTTVTFVGTPASFADNATIASNFAGGADPESDASLRLRTLRALAQPSFGGNQNDWQNAALAVAGVTRVFTSPATPTPGAVTIWPLFDDLRVDGIPVGTDAWFRPGTGPSAGIGGTGDQRVVLGGVLALRPICTHVYVTALVASPIAITIANLSPSTDPVKAAIATELTAMLRRRAAPTGAGYTISRSWLEEAIARAAGENSHDLTVPAANIPIAAGHLATLGLITYV